MQRVPSRLLSTNAAATYDVAIIGAGIIGSSIALELSNRGIKTVNLERHQSSGYGSTSYSSSIIRYHYSTRHGCALAWEGYNDWTNFSTFAQGGGGDKGFAEFRQTGALLLNDPGFAPTLKKMTDHAQALGIPVEFWDKQQILQRYPYFDLTRYGPPKLVTDDTFGVPSGGEIDSAVCYPHAGYVNDPQLATYNIVTAAQAKGAEFQFRKNITKINKEGNRATGVTLDDGSVVNAKVVVNCGGPHSSFINKMAGVTDDMKIQNRPLRVEVAYVEAPKDVDFNKDGMIINDSDVGIYLRPESGNKILIGGVEPPCDTLTYVDDPDNFNTNFTDHVMDHVYRWCLRMPSLGIPNQASGVVALYDAADDWIPIYDKSCLDGYYMACGTSGNQFKNAITVGRVMSDLIEYCEAGNDHDSKPAQHTLPWTGYELNIGLFSRLREIEENSSFSVLG